MIFIVTDKATGAEVRRYEADQIDQADLDNPMLSVAEQIQIVYVPQAGDIAPVPVSRILTKLEYLRRFTMEERIAVRQAAESSPMLADYLAMMELAEEIDTGDADTIGAVNMLEQVGLIGAGRASGVLNGQ